MVSKKYLILISFDDAQLERFLERERERESEQRAKADNRTSDKLGLVGERKEKRD